MPVTGLVHRATARAPYAAVALGLLGVYALGLGAVLLAPRGSDVAVWWPAAGLSVCLLILAPPRWRWPLVAGIVVATGLANFTAGRGVVSALGFGLSNAAEAYVVVRLLTRGGREALLLRLSDLRRLALATLAGTVVVGTGIGSTVALTLGGSFPTAAVAVVASHAAAILVFAPLAMRGPAPPPARGAGEVGAQWALLVAATGFVFAPGNILSLTFLPLPLLLWAALRFGLRVVSCQLLVLGVMATTLTLLGGGPFALDVRNGVTNAATTASLLQAFLIAAALIALPFGVAVDQRRGALAGVTQSEELFRKSFSDSFVGMLLLAPGPQGLQVQEVNQTAAAILGRDPAALEGTLLEPLFTSDSDFRELARRIAAGELAGWREETWLAGARHRRIGLALSPLSVSAGQEMLSAQMVDITEAHEAATKLRAEKDFTAAVLNNTDCLIVVADAEGRVLGVNPAAERACGHAEAALLGRPLWESLFCDGEAPVRALLDRARSTPERLTFESDVHAPAGGRRRVIWSSAPLSGEDESRAHAVLTGIDVTDERNVRSMTNHLLDSANSTAFVGLNRRGMVTVFNSGAEELLGYSAEEVVGRLRIDALHEPGELRAAAAEAGTTADFAVLAAGADEQPQTRDWTYVRKDGSRVVCSVTVSAVRDAFDAHIGYLAVARDVTESRRSQQLLVETLAKEREAVERLRELDRAKSDFVSMVSHELRTPITSIVGYSEMLQEGAAGPVSTGQERLLDAVRRNGDRLIALIEDLLTLSRIEAGTFTLEKTRLDLGTVMAAAEEALSPLLAGRRLDVRFTRPPHQVELMGDPAQLERVILNLVGNAVKFTEDGGRVVCALRTEEDRAVLTVSDTGIGIPAEEQGALFRRFFRSSTAQERAIQGTGLGLSIVQSIVHSHGGQIAISSEHLVGTEVSVELPLVELPRELVASARPGSA